MSLGRANSAAPDAGAAVGFTSGLDAPASFAPVIAPLADASLVAATAGTGDIRASRSILPAVTVRPATVLAPVVIRAATLRSMASMETVKSSMWPPSAPASISPAALNARTRLTGKGSPPERSRMVPPKSAPDAVILARRRGFSGTLTTPPSTLTIVPCPRSRLNTNGTVRPWTISATFKLYPRRRPPNIRLPLLSTGP